MARKLNHEVFAPRTGFPPAVRVALAVAVIAAISVAVALNWSRFAATDEERFQEAYDAGHLDEAMEIARRLAAESDDPTRAFLAIAAVRIESARRGQDVTASLAAALEAARAAEELDRTNPEIARVIGFILALQGDTDGAIERYRAALSADPNDAATLSQMGALLERQGDRAGAGAYYARAVDAEPGDDQSRVLYAQFLLGTGSTTDALSEAMAAANRTENAALRGDAWRVVAAARLAQGNTRLALDAAERAVEANPTSPAAHVTLGEIELRAVLTGQSSASFDEGLAAVRARADGAITADPSLAAAYFLGFKVAFSQNDAPAAARYEASMLDALAGDPTLSPEQREAMATYVQAVRSVKLTPSR